MAGLSLALAPHGNLVEWHMVALAAAAALAAFWALWQRRYRLARVAAAAQVTLILWGWGLAQFPFLLPPDLPIELAAAPRATLRLVLATVVAGAVVLFPSLYYLFKVFKGERT